MPLFRNLRHPSLLVIARPRNLRKRSRGEKNRGSSRKFFVARVVIIMSRDLSTGKSTQIILGRCGPKWRSWDLFTGKSTQIILGFPLGAP